MKHSQILERALEECGYDLDATIKRLDEIAMGSFVETGGSAMASGTNIEQGSDLNELQRIVRIDT